MTEEPNENMLLAQLAYGAYGQTTNYKNFQGNPMPDFDNLGPAIQTAWINAAQAVVNYLMGPPAADE